MTSRFCSRTRKEPTTSLTSSMRRLRRRRSGRNHRRRARWSGRVASRNRRAGNSRAWTVRSSRLDHGGSRRCGGRRGGRRPYGCSGWSRDARVRGKTLRRQDQERGILISIHAERGDELTREQTVQAGQRRRHCVHRRSQRSVASSFQQCSHALASTLGRIRSSPRQVSDVTATDRRKPRSRRRT